MERFSLQSDPGGGVGKHLNPGGWVGRFSNDPGGVGF